MALVIRHCPTAGGGGRDWEGRASVTGLGEDGRDGPSAQQPAAPGNCPSHSLRAI